ncbi:MAG: FUSC family protein, partial [Desulfobulbus sp.]|nr:FUSC family protein [Desulfobulbus sp.]
MNEAAPPRRVNPLLAVLADWRSSEGPRWLFVVKVLLAAFLALWIAFFLGFDSPRSAMLTVFIVALPSTGLALEKSIYRLIGTLVGSVAALALIGLFGQHAPLLFLALAAWAGSCTAGAAYLRNARSYGFVLSGYTACMIVLPSINYPLGAFDVAIARVTEISLGILCYALVNDVFFPSHQSDQIVFRVRGLYTAFATLCRDAMRYRITREELERRHLQISADAATLEAERLAALFEAGEMRLHSRKLHALHTATVATLTTFHTLHQLMERLRNRADSPIPALMRPLFAAFTDALLIGDEVGNGVDNTPARNAAEAEITLGKLDLLLRGLPLIGASLRAEHGATLDAYRRLDLDTALELLQRFAAEYRALVAIYAA